jgi:hypothetical protein
MEIRIFNCKVFEVFTAENGGVGGFIVASSSIKALQMRKMKQIMGKYL